jgi:hypothetical protein
MKITLEKIGTGSYLPCLAFEIGCSYGGGIYNQPRGSACSREFVHSRREKDKQQTNREAYTGTVAIATANLGEILAPIT